MISKYTHKDEIIVIIEKKAKMHIMLLNISHAALCSPRLKKKKHLNPLNRSEIFHQVTFLK